MLTTEGMDILERLKIVVDGGLDNWPIASSEWEYKEAIKEITTLRQQLAEVQKDADRYRFVDDTAGWSICHNDKIHGWLPVNARDIDAAMKETT